jgi:hypothetical protein
VHTATATLEQAIPPPGHDTFGYAELLAKAALRIRIDVTAPSPFMAALADLLDQEAAAAVRCLGIRCPFDPDEGERCPAEQADIEITDTDSEHHHCRWCLYNGQDPAAVAAARAYLTGGA